MEPDVRSWRRSVGEDQFDFVACASERNRATREAQGIAVVFAIGDPTVARRQCDAPSNVHFPSAAVESREHFRLPVGGVTRTCVGVFASIVVDHLHAQTVVIDPQAWNGPLQGVPAKAARIPGSAGSGEGVPRLRLGLAENCNLGPVALSQGVEVSACRVHRHEELSLGNLVAGRLRSTHEAPLRSAASLSTNGGVRSRLLPTPRAGGDSPPRNTVVMNPFPPGRRAISTAATWTQSLHYHPHVHLIVTAGGLSQDGRRWVPNRWGERYLFPVRVLSRLFRSSFVRALDRARAQGKLVFVGGAAELANDEGFAELKRDLYSRDWVVYAKRAFPGVRKLYRYLGRYTHRVGLSNSRLLSVDEQGVTIRTRAGTATFEVYEFMRRFLQHIPPKGFVRVRHFGLFASTHLARLHVVQKLLGNTTTDHGVSESTDVPAERPEEACPACLFGSLVRVEVDPDPSYEDLWDP